MLDTFIYDRGLAIIANLSTRRTCMSDEAWTVLKGFLDAEYGVEPEDTAPLRIGQPARSPRARHWITAFNPLGLARSDALNRADQDALLGALAEAGVACSIGYARSPAAATEPWFEPCAVAVDAGHDRIDALALRFQQLATVVVAAASPARLRCYRGPWRTRFGVSDMDAPNVDWVA
jgi:hypothetical protein